MAHQGALARINVPDNDHVNPHLLPRSGSFVASLYY
jgi:hypothetical protein